MKDTEINELLKIPLQTLYQWKKADASDWRAIIYKYFSLKDASEIKPDIERIEKILEVKKI